MASHILAIHLVEHDQCSASFCLCRLAGNLFYVLMLHKVAGVTHIDNIILCFYMHMHAF